MARSWAGLLAVWTVLLAGCGFQLRGEAQLPFPSAYVDATDASLLAPGLRRTLEAQGKLATSAKDASVRIRLVDERREKTILSLSGGGKVREYRLHYKVTMQVTDAAGNELIAPVELQQLREYSYDDALILAKGAEEASLNRAMEQETLRQALRRLSYVKR